MGSKNANVKNHKKDKRKKKGEDSWNSNHSTPNDGNVISDPRFSRVHTDPRFREAPKRETKVAIDSRFDRLFTDKSFLPSSAPVDKRGKPKNNATSQPGSLRHYYKINENEVEQISDEEEDEKEEGLVKANRVKPESDEEETSESEESATESEEASESESAIDTDTDTDTDTDSDEGADEEIYEEGATETQEDIPEIKKETHRLAVVNMDWRYVKAVDLYVLLSSFVPPNGLIKSVAVYPSEFGLQRMKEEEVHGPVGLFDDENEKSDEDSSDDDIENEKLRAYEKSRMRYYYAVVECDSSTTADCIYKECDGLEFIQSSNALDLRFIPDNMEFKHSPRDVATEAPANYECKDFYSRALQHSKVNLSWDEDEPLRVKTLNRKFTDEQLAQLELKEFLTSDESESDGEDNNETDQPDKKARKQDKYRALLQSGNDSDGGDEHGNVQDMEVTFNTGLEDISKHIMEKKDKKSETVWEAYLRKRLEKKKARKNKTKYISDDDDDDDNNDTEQEATEEADDFFIEEAAVKKRKRTQNKNEEHKLQDMNGVEKASKEELELLLADEKGTNTGLKGYNLKFNKGKGKKREKAINEGKIPSSAYDDPRFAALFSPDYVIDPTNPQFKRSAAHARQLAQKQQKGNKDLGAEKDDVKHEYMQLSSDDIGMKKVEEEGLDALKLKKDKHDLSSLVKSIKMKSKQVQLPSDGNRRKDGKSQIKGMKKKRH
ncbi:ESF1 homolog [Abrus precatorius]|uniref:ESF1 homolog n=1 Tax=Abrus precatorius TaxID=3816 RepID=A0A8B8KPA3_ABRPR|nr:ESF1 homolog [Abrus precatorius]